MKKLFFCRCGKETQCLLHPLCMRWLLRMYKIRPPGNWRHGASAVKVICINLQNLRDVLCSGKTERRLSFSKKKTFKITQSRNHLQCPEIGRWINHGLHTMPHWGLGFKYIFPSTKKENVATIEEAIVCIHIHSLVKQELVEWKLPLMVLWLKEIRNWSPNVCDVR